MARKTTGPRKPSTMTAMGSSWWVARISAGSRVVGPREAVGEAFPELAHDQAFEN